MKISSITICCALGTTMLAAIIYVVTTNKHSKVDDFQIDVDQGVDLVSCYLLAETTVHLAFHPFLYRMLTSFGFRYDANCTR
jgi:hypothetical protein